MDSKKVDSTILQLETILFSVRLQNSGQDIHTIGNIRNTAGLLIQQLKKDPNCFEDELVEQIVRNIRDKVVEFFKEKYIENPPAKTGSLYTDFK